MGNKNLTKYLFLGDLISRNKSCRLINQIKYLRWAKLKAKSSTLEKFLRRIVRYVLTRWDQSRQLIWRFLKWLIHRNCLRNHTKKFIGNFRWPFLIKKWGRSCWRPRNFLNGRWNNKDIAWGRLIATRITYLILARHTACSYQ